MLENYAWAKGMTAVPTFLISSIWSWHNIRDILSGLRGRRPGLLLSLPKSSFQMKVNSAFYFEILNLWFDVPYYILVLVVAGRWQCSHPPGVLHASICWQTLQICQFSFPAGLSSCQWCQNYCQLVCSPCYFCAWLPS